MSNQISCAKCNPDHDEPDVDWCNNCEGYKMTRGMPMVGALVRDVTMIMKIVTAYMCDGKGEYIRFAGDGPTMWRPLDDFEILSMGE